MNYFTKSKYNNQTENYGSEFSVLNSHNFSKYETSEKTAIDSYTVFLYILSLISVGCCLLALSVLPFGHYFQFLLVFLVLLVNLIIFRWSKLV
jgi:hypothetical protein